MKKGLISVCIVSILIFSIFGCARTAEDTSAAETEGMQTENTDAADTELETVGTENTETEIEEEADAEVTEASIVEEEYVQSEEEITFQTQGNAIDNMWRECDLPRQEWPDYVFFKNAQEGHYNLSLENTVAFAVKDYALNAAMGNEQWELKKIYHCRDDIYLAYTESDMESELYILFRTDTPTALPYYIIVADIRKGDEEDITLQNDYYSYNSMLEWYSYQDGFDGKLSGEQPQFDVTDDIHDSIYRNGVFYAIYDYVDRVSGDKKNHWVMSDNDVYVGKNGFIACAHCSNGVQNLMVFVDVWNWTYAVLE